MERKVIWTILIGIILFVAVFFILINRLPQPSAPIPSLIEKTIPKYRVGDILGNETIKEDPKLLIINNEKIRFDTATTIVLDYNNQTDEYLVDLIFKNTDGNWRRIYPDVVWTDRKRIEDFNPILKTHIDISKLITLYSSNDDMVAAIEAAWIAGEKVGYFSLDEIITPTPTSAIPERPVVTYQPTMRAITLSGAGDNVHTISIPKAGIYIITTSATPIGKSYGDFSVYITDINGLGYDGIGYGLVFNEFVEPSYTGTKSVRLSSGRYLVSVEGHCTYNIMINSI